MPEPLEPQRETFSIVVLGDFNPAIFQPLWFGQNELLALAEAEQAKIDIISRDVASFTIAGINIQVTRDRLGFTISEPQHEPVMRDLAYGTLCFLEHTPLNAIGFNRDMEFARDSDEARNQIGFALVPRENWNTFLEPEGMVHLTYQGKRPDCSATIQFRIRPSSEVVPFGIFVGVNQHYLLKISEADVRIRHGEAIRALNDDWRSFIGYAHSAACQLLLRIQDSPTCL